MHSFVGKCMKQWSWPYNESEEFNFIQHNKWRDSLITILFKIIYMCQGQCFAKQL